MDFSQVKIVEKANPRKIEVISVEKPTFHLKVDYAKEKLTFSPALFDTLTLEHNSLAQGVGPGNELLLIVMPGSTGVFAKNQEGGGKGRQFKNALFVKDLKTRGWEGGKFNLELAGENEGKTYYIVVPFAEAVVETPVATPVVAESEPEQAASAFREEPTFN